MGLSTVAGDADLVTDNIKSGVTIFAVSGKSSVVDTAREIAAASDLRLGKTAYVNGSRVTGNLAGGVPCTCPGGSSPLGRWCDNGDGTVTDTTNGLVWLKNASWGGYKPWVNSTTWDDVHTRVGILISGMGDLTDGSVAGDWRLPTKEEFVTMTTGTEYIRSGSMSLVSG